MSMGAAEFSSCIGNRESAHDAQPLPLISAARMQKFDLLSHLAVNLAQPIVVCGPKGIGKTTFLRLLEIRLAPLATVRYLASMPGMSYERILDELSRSLSQDKTRSAFPGSSVSDLLANYGKEHRNVVLLIDDAGALVPGLLNALWQFANGYPALRLVLAMRSDEALQKSDTDRSALGDAFILDIPALSQDECRSYLHQLATAVPGSTAEGITDSFIQRLYSRSRGVPGVVVERLKSPSGSTRTAALANAGWITGAGLLAGAVAYAFFLFFSNEALLPDRPIPDSSAALVQPDRVVAASAQGEVLGVKTSSPAEPLAETRSSAVAENVAASQPPSAPVPLVERETVEIPPAPVPSAATPIAIQPLLAAVPAVETTATKAVEDSKPMESAGQYALPPPLAEETKKNNLETPGQSSSAPPEPAESLNEPATKMSGSGTLNAQSEKDERSKSSEIMVDGLKSAEWLMSQSPETYTLQIVAVSRFSSVVKLAKQFPSGSELASFRSRKGRGDLYPLFFGIYPNLLAAKEAAAALPVSLGQPLPRQMKSIHQEIRRMMSRHAELGASAR